MTRSRRKKRRAARKRRAERKRIAGYRTWGPRWAPSNFVSDSAVDDAIDAWHGSKTKQTLAEFLGWSDSEYTAWVEERGLSKDYD